MPTSERFAVLDHDWPTPHRDLLLESNGVLRTWRLPADFTGDDPTPAEAIFDHRRTYLDYEGPLSGDRGTVRRWDGGTLEWLESGETCLRVRLSGRHLCGVYVMKHLVGKRWECCASGAG